MLGLIPRDWVHGPGVGSGHPDFLKAPQGVLTCSQLIPTGLDWRWKRKYDLPGCPVAQQCKREGPWAWPITPPPSPLRCLIAGYVAQWKELTEFWFWINHQPPCDGSTYNESLDNVDAGQGRPELTNSLFAGLVTLSPCFQFPHVISSSQTFQICTFVKIAQSFLVEQIFFPMNYSDLGVECWK